MSDQLAALTVSGRVLCDVLLGANRGNIQLVLCLDEAHLRVDPLIIKGVHCGIHTALTSIGSHHGGIDFDVVV